MNAAFHTIDSGKVNFFLININTTNWTASFETSFNIQEIKYI